MKQRTEGHTETKISGDTRADWSEAFELVPSLQVAYVWHASLYTGEVLDGLLRIGFIHHQQIIWDKQRTVLTRSLYWFQHEPAWFVRKKNAPWYGKAGENSTVWAASSPKFIMGGSKEVGDDKQDHPTQKPVELMQQANSEPYQTRRGHLRAVLGQRHDADRCGNDGAPVLQRRTRPQVRRCNRTALARLHTWPSHAGGRWPHFRGGKNRANGCSSMNRTLSPRDRGSRAAVAGWPSRHRRIVFGLVGLERRTAAA